MRWYQRLAYVKNHPFASETLDPDHKPISYRFAEKRSGREEKRRREDLILILVETIGKWQAKCLPFQGRLCLSSRNSINLTKPNQHQQRNIHDAD